MLEHLASWLQTLNESRKGYVWGKLRVFLITVCIAPDTVKLGSV